MADEQIRYDIEGTETITTALRTLVNQYPLLPEYDTITFANLGEESGKAIYPITGAVIQSETEDITGHVEQVCLYPFAAVYRGAGLSESRKVNVKEWLENLGRWLEGQPVVVDGVEYTLDQYPKIGQREIINIRRQSPAFLESTYDNRVEDWVIHITANYTNEFDN